MKDAVGRLGPVWLSHFNKNEGLEAQNFNEEGFIKAAKLRAEPPASYPGSFYVQLLATRGPLWINAGDGIVNHATILTGARTDKDGRVAFRLVDPAKGAFLTQSEDQFGVDFEREAWVIYNQNLNWEFRYQIFHW